MYTVWKIWLHSSSAVSGTLSSLYLAMRFMSAMTCSFPALHASMAIRHIENTITAVRYGGLLVWFVRMVTFSFLYRA